MLITGPTGAGTSWLACALAQYACRSGYSAVYQRVLRLQEELRIRHGSGAFGKWLLLLAKTDVLVLDDWGMGTIDSMTRSDLLEIIDDRAGNRATISPASCRLNTGMRGSETPPSLTPSWTVSCSATIASRSPATRCVPNGLKPAKRREISTYRDRSHYNLNA